MKKIKVMALTALSALSISSFALASDDITVMVNKSKLQLEVSPQIVNGRVLVPVRAISENLGAKVGWNNSIRTVKINFKGKTIDLTIGSRTAVVNGKRVYLDQPAKIVNDRVIVPIRFISENMGAKVGWNDKTRTVNVDTPEVIATPPVVDSAPVKPSTPTEESNVPKNEETPKVNDNLGNQVSSSIQENNIFKNTALQLTTTCENSTTEPQYNYAEDINDGRGVTFGIIGFCTGTYDGNQLIKYYTELNPNNSLAKYIPALDKIDKLSHNGNGGDSNNSKAGLEGFIEAVNSNKDPVFRQAQLKKLDELYWNPAVRIFKSIGGKSSLTQAFIYDMTVNHSQWGTQDFVDKATKALGGTPATNPNISESAFLSKLMDVRYSYLVVNDNPGSDRVNAFKRLLQAGNMSLEKPFSFTVYGDTFTVDPMKNVIQ